MNSPKCLHWLILLALLSSGASADDWFEQQQRAQQQIDEQLLRLGTESLLREIYSPGDRDVIRNAQERAIELQDAIQYDFDPDPLIETIDIDLAQRVRPRPIMVSPGRATVVQIVDASGQPWPINRLAVGDTDQRVISVGQDEDNPFLNSFTITARAVNGTSNLTLLLADKFLSFGLRVEVSRDIYHEGPILRINEFGPQAQQAEIATIGVLSNDEAMKMVAARMGPEGYTLLKTSNPSVQVWESPDREWFVASNMLLRNPVPRETYMSGTGIYAFRSSPWNTLRFNDSRGNELRVTVERGL